MRTEIVRCPRCGTEAEASVGPRGGVQQLTQGCDCILTPVEEKQMREAARSAATIDAQHHYSGELGHGHHYADEDTFYSQEDR